MPDEDHIVKNDNGDNKKKSKIFIIIGLLIFIIAASGGGVAFFLINKKKDNNKKVVLESDPAVIRSNLEELNNSIFIKMPSLTVTMNNKHNKAMPHHLQADIYLQVKDKADEKIIDKIMPIIQDSAQGVLRGLQPDDFFGSQGVYRLKDVLRTVINREIFPKKIQQVLVTKLLVQ